MKRPALAFAWCCFVATALATPTPAPPFLETVPVPGVEWRAGKYLVTQAQYENVTGENPSRFVDPEAPVDSVSWEDAKAFCAQLTARDQKSGRLAPSWLYDLPTDAQWDQLAAGTDVTNAVTSLKTARTGTARVGSGKPNPLGIYDALGNVWEWCLDWYGNEIRKRDSNKDMPYIMTDAEVAAHGPEENFKVLRGGAWDTGPSDEFTPAARLRYAPSMRNARTGFRCVLERTPTK